MELETKFSLRARIVHLQKRLQEILDSVWFFLISVFSTISSDLKEFGYLIAGKDNSGNKIQRPPKPIPTPPQAMQSPKPSRETKQRKYRCPEWLKTGTQIVGTIGAFVAAYFIYEQWQTQIQSLKMDERAWVSIKSVSLTVAPSATGEGKISITIVNGGKTPALRVDVIQASFSQTANAKLHFVAPHTAMAIGPGIGPVELTLNVPTMNEVQSSYVHFVIQYWDVFQKPTDGPHHTIYCGVYWPTQGGFNVISDAEGCNSMN